MAQAVRTEVWSLAHSPGWGDVVAVDESQIIKAREQNIYKSLNCIPEQSSGRFVGVGNTSIQQIEIHSACHSVKDSHICTGPKKQPIMKIIIGTQNWHRW